MPQNYRPISILAALGKIFEKIIFLQLSRHCEVNNIINPHQWGFRRGLSTDIAIGKFLERVIEGFNENKYGIGVFLDLQKAFDLVNHSLLLRKLHHYGLRGPTLDIIQSFLSSRKQGVKVNNVISSSLPVNIGTPQGSVLSPLLFNIFINDLVNCSSELYFTLYADDTSVYLNDNNINSLFNNMNSELKKLSEWISSNFLSLNVKKTVYLLFSGKKPISSLPQLKIFEKEILQKSETKFLGLYIDRNLNWKAHTQLVSGKVSRMIGIISKLQPCLTLPAMRTLYLSLAHHHLRYGLTFWGAAPKTALNKLFMLQKKIVRLIHRSEFLEHTEPLFKNSFILKLDDMRKLEMSKFIYTDLNGQNFFQFAPRNAIHSHGTRNRNRLNLPTPRSNILLNSVFFEGIRIFNEIADQIKLAPSRNSFKYQYKNQIVMSYNSSS